jgi:hypothetical protein
MGRSTVSFLETVSKDALELKKNALKADLRRKSFF